MKRLAAILALIALPWLVWQNYHMADRIATLTAERATLATYAVACYRQTYKDI